MSDTDAGWHDDVYFGIHYDLHANVTDTALGSELTAGHLRERLSRIRPDWIQCDCKGHPGYTSWPTEVGSTSPGVVRDALHIHRRVTRELGIRLGVHYSGVWDARAVELHPEWARVDENGHLDARITCPLSGYTEELMIPQMLEVIDRYDVDGFWVDGENWAARPCWCERCQAEFTRRTGIANPPRAPDEPHWEEWLAFHRDLFVEHVTKYTEAIHARKPECLVCSNWMYTARQPEAVRAPVDYFSGDYGHSRGADRAALEGRVLDGRGRSWDLMVWSFTRAPDTPDPHAWCVKTATHLCQEVAEVVALGGAVMVYEVPQRTGWLTGWHHELIAEVADFCRARHELRGSQTMSQVAVLHLADHYYAHNDPLFNYGDALQPLEGALHALLETHRSTDVLVWEAAQKRLGDYELIVVPEQTRLSDEVSEALESFARAGGHVLLSGPHLARERPRLVGAWPRGDPLPGVGYLPVGERAASAFGEWQPVLPIGDSEVWVRLLSQQEPTRNRTDRAVVVRRPLGGGEIVSVHGPLFRNYFFGHSPLLREFIGLLVGRMDIPWSVTLDAPPHLEMILRRKGEQLLINLINRGWGELPLHRPIVETLPPVREVTLHVRCDAPPQEVSILPEARSFSWSYADGVTTVYVPKVHIHSIVSVSGAM